VLLFDKRGTGISDPVVGGAASLEERMDDVRAVMDAVGSERAALMGASDGAAMVALFAATYPERTAARCAPAERSRREQLRGRAHPRRAVRRALTGRHSTLGWRVR
jgi:pimeloyl-ACP methyl ester carboxylesterase